MSSMYKSANPIETRRQELQALRQQRRENILNTRRNEMILKTAYVDYYRLLDYVLSFEEFKYYIPNTSFRPITVRKEEQLVHFLNLLAEGESFNCLIPENIPTLDPNFLKLCPDIFVSNDDILKAISENEMECKRNFEAFGLNFSTMNVMTTILTFIFALSNYIEQNIIVNKIYYGNLIEIVLNCLDVLEHYHNDQM